MSTQSNPQITPERIMQYAWGYAVPLIMEAAIRNRIFDVLDAGPMTVSAIAAATGASLRGVTMIANALVGFDLLAKDAEDRYLLTPESAAFLVSTKPGFCGGMIAHTSEDLIPRWLNLSEVVRTGVPQHDVMGDQSEASFFEKFVEGIFNMSYPAARLAAQALGSDGARMLDIGTGSGVWGIAFAQANRDVTVTAVDYEDVFRVTRKMTARFGVADHFRYVPGDLFAVDYGTGHRIAALGHILHGLGPDQNRRLLRKISDAMVAGGEIVIAEFLVDQDRRGPKGGLIFAVNMLVNTKEGGTYSLEEIGAWLQEAGFENVRTMNAPGPSPLIVATKK